MSQKKDINIQLATEDDIVSIMQMNNHWVIKDPNSIDTSNGYLNVDPFSKEDLKQIIKSKELIVAKDGELIAGYYLFDNYSNTDYLNRHKKLIKDCITEGLLDNNQRVSLRMQCVINRQYQNQNLSKRMFHRLLSETINKYDVYFASVSIENPKYKAHIKIGWEVLKRIDELILLVYKNNNFTRVFLKDKIT